MKRTKSFREFLNEGHEIAPDWVWPIWEEVLEILPRLKGGEWRRGVGNWWWWADENGQKLDWYEYPEGGIWFHEDVKGFTVYDDKGNPMEISPLDTKSWWRFGVGDETPLWTKNPIELAYVISPKLTKEWSLRNREKAGNLTGRMNAKESGLIESAGVDRKEIGKEFVKRLKTIDDKNPYGEFVDWWCVSGRDYDEYDIAYLENLERIERNVPEERRHVGEVFIVEFMVHLHPKGGSGLPSTQFSYRLISLDTRSLDLRINADIKGKIREEIQGIYDDVLRDMKPGQLKGMKSGLL